LGSHQLDLDIKHIKFWPFANPSSLKSRYIATTEIIILQLLESALKFAEQSMIWWLSLMAIVQLH
jgi:hypothetical protein